ncbi:MAG: VOC family protein [Candidatus Micrarchaeales archaeon]
MLSKSKHASLIPVKNMSRAIRFYTNTLGGSLNMRGTKEMRDYWASVNVGKAEFWLVKPDKIESRKLSYNTFTVKNIRATVKGLKSKSVKFLPAENMGPGTKINGPIASGPFGANAFFKDSEGNLLMLWQIPKM